MSALLALALAFAGPAAAALNISASVDKNALGLDDQLVLTVTVSGDSGSLPDPEMPSMPRFNVHSAGSSQSMTIVNGHFSNEAQYNFVLVPRMIGNALIPPITVHSGSQSAQSQPIAVTVLRPNQAPPPAAARPAAPSEAARGRPGGGASQPAFVTAELDKRSAYVNEQVLYTVRFYYSVPLAGNAEWSPPDTTGLLSEDLPPQPAHTELRGGRNYSVSEVHIALFPLTAGAKTVGAGTIKCQVQKGVDVDPFASDFFRQFFSAGLTTVVPVELRTKPLRLEVKALPQAGRPAGFDGAVGRFKLRSQVDKTSLKAGDAVTLTVTVEGQGNLKALGALALPAMPDFRVYDTVTSLDESKTAFGVSGSKVYKTVMVPKVSGSLVIPAVPFSYFDPGQGRYVTLRTTPVTLTVAPGAATAPPVGSQALPGASPAAIMTLSQDIRHVSSHPGSDALADAAAAVAGAGWLNAFPAAALALSALVAAWREKAAQDPTGQRARRAARAAEERLSRSRSAPAPQAVALVGDALVDYLADKLGVPPSGLTLRQATEHIKRRWPALPDGHLEQAKRLWGEMERLRYAPTLVRDGDVEHLRGAVRELVKALEEATS